MPEVAASVTRDQSPPLMMLGIIYALLFNAGLVAVSPLFASGSFPVPSSSAEQIVTFFRENGRQVAITSALQFGSAIPLGLFTDHRDCGQKATLSSHPGGRSEHSALWGLDDCRPHARSYIRDVGYRLRSGCGQR